MVTVAETAGAFYCNGAQARHPGGPVHRNPGGIWEFDFSVDRDCVLVRDENQKILFIVADMDFPFLRLARVFKLDNTGRGDLVMHWAFSLSRQG